MKNMKNINGFTLVELLVVIAIISVLGAIVAPNALQMIERSQTATDMSNLKTLNQVTPYYGHEMRTTGNIFPGIATDAERIQELVDQDFLEDLITPKRSDYSFIWDADSQKWYYLSTDGDFPFAYTISVNLDGLTFGSGWSSSILSGSYTGSADHIIIPGSIDGTIITRIWQDVFREAGLTAVSFDTGSQLDRIHARAFQGNQLTTIELPATLTRIDTRAFFNNPITAVTLPEGLTTIENNAFNSLTRITAGSNLSALSDGAINGNNAFRDAYTAAGGGAGIYTWDGSQWEKE